MNDQMIHPEHDASRNSRGITPIPCDEVLDLIPAMALGAIETGSAHLVRLHCDSCAACAAELAESERVTRLLPFSAPGRVPSAGAKLALMERITTLVPALSAVPVLSSPIIDSPAAKRRSTPVNSGSSGDLLEWTRDLVSGKALRLAAAPIALALVLVSLYSLGTFDPASNGDALLPTAQAAETDVETSAGTEIQMTFLSAGTRGATVTQPSVATGAALGSSFMARSNRSLAQTELVRSVAPKIAECSIQEGAGGDWIVEVNGVSFSNSGGSVDMYLVSKSGQTFKVGKVFLDRDGNGVLRFNLDQPLSDFSLIRIGSKSDDVSIVGTPRHYTFQIDLAARQSQGLGRPD